MSIEFKVSNNNRGYKNLSQEFIDSNTYEIDLSGNNKYRQIQVKMANDAFQEGQVIFYLKDKNGNIYKGKMKSKFEKNTSDPFYLRENVKSKARNGTDISNHPFFTCNVKWSKEKLNHNETLEFNEKCKGKFLAKTIVKL